MKLNLASTRLTRSADRHGTIAAFAFMFLFMLSSTTAVFGQGSGTSNGKKWKEQPASATISSSYAITLDSAEPLHHLYQADISHLAFQDATAAKQLFKRLNDPAWTIKVDWGQEKNIYIILRPNELTKTWSVDQWTQRLQAKAQQL